MKTGRYIIGDNFMKYEPIFTVFAPLGRELNFQQNPSNISHFTLTMVPHYLGKFIILICLKLTTVCAHCDELSETRNAWFVNNLALSFICY